MNSYVQPTSSRLKITTSDSSVEITNVINNSKWDILLLGLPLVIYWISFLYLSFTMIKKDLNSVYGYDTPSLLYIFPMLYLFGAILLTFAVVHRFTFSEIIYVSEKDIVISHRSRIFRRLWRYSAEHIQDLRTSTSPINHPLAFDYGAKTIMFGQGLSESEGKRILKEIQTRFSRYHENTL